MLPAEKKKILIIDDDSRNIFALSAILKSRGYLSLTATGAMEGIDMLLQDKEIRAVLLDMMMPDMDGYEALTHIRNQEAIARVPVIAVTAQAMVGDREKCLEAGADAYVSKPIDIDILLRLLEHY